MVYLLRFEFRGPRFEINSTSVAYQLPSGQNLVCFYVGDTEKKKCCNNVFLAECQNNAANFARLLIVLLLQEEVYLQLDNLIFCGGGGGRTWMYCH